MHIQLLHSKRRRYPTILMHEDTHAREQGRTAENMIITKAIGQLVVLGYDVAACTPAPYQRPRLGRPSCGVLILRPASRLDAFSAYPIQTPLPGGAPGGTTGKREVCPARSSRTSARTTQYSCAHDR